MNAMELDPLAGALCRTEGHPSWWDDELDGVQESDTAKARRHGKAKTICGRCPVRARCGARVVVGMDSGIRAGVLIPADTVRGGASGWLPPGRGRWQGQQLDRRRGVVA